MGVVGQNGVFRLEHSQALLKLRRLGIAGRQFAFQTPYQVEWPVSRHHEIQPLLLHKVVARQEVMGSPDILTENPKTLPHIAGTRRCGELPDQGVLRRRAYLQIFLQAGRTPPSLLAFCCQLGIHSMCPFEVTALHCRSLHLVSPQATQ